MIDSSLTQVRSSSVVSPGVFLSIHHTVPRYLFIEITCSYQSRQDFYQSHAALQDNWAVSFLNLWSWAQVNTLSFGLDPMMCFTPFRLEISYKISQVLNDVSHKYMYFSMSFFSTFFICSAHFCQFFIFIILLIGCLFLKLLVLFVFYIYLFICQIHSY